MELVFMVEAALELGNREAVHALRPFVARYTGKNLLAGQFVALPGFRFSRVTQRILDGWQSDWGLLGPRPFRPDHVSLALQDA